MREICCTRLTKSKFLMKHKISEVHELLVRAWSRVVSQADASYVGDAVIAAAISKDGRMNPMRESIGDLKDSLDRPPTYKVVFSSGSCSVLDFSGTSPLGL